MKSNRHDLFEDIICLLRFYKESGLEFIERSEKVKALLETLDKKKPSSSSPNQYANLCRKRQTVQPCRHAAHGAEATTAAPYREFIAQKPGKLQQILQTACKNCVFFDQSEGRVTGAGKSDAKLIVAGGLPGREDITEGVPFQGEAGVMLTKMLRAIGIERSGVWLTLAAKCRAPNAKEKEYLKKESRCNRAFIDEIEHINPSFILCLGRLPAQMLLSAFGANPEENAGPEMELQDLRGRVICLKDKGIKMIVTHSPSHILSQNQPTVKKLKKEAWHDLQLLEKIYKGKS